MIKCRCGREYTPRQVAKGFIGKVNGEICCIVCADHKEIKQIELNAFGITL